MQEMERTGQENRFVTALREVGKAALGFGKAQLILFGVNFAVLTIGMLIVGMGWWSLLIALGVSLLDMLPVIGSGVALVPWSVIALIAGNARMGIGVGATYIAMVVLRMVLDPIITGRSIGLPPLLTLLASAAGLILFGGVGAIAGPAVAALANILFRVLRGEPSAPAEPGGECPAAERENGEPPADCAADVSEHKL